MIERSGGNSGGWTVERLDVAFPSRVQKGPFSKQWLTPISASFEIPIESAAEKVIPEAFGEPPWQPLERRVIGETHDPDWYRSLPAGLPHIVESAVSRQRAIETLRGVGESLLEAVAYSSQVERRVIEETCKSLDRLIDLLSLNGPNGEWLATEAQAKTISSHAISWLIQITMLVEGIVSWAEATELLKAALTALGISL